MYLKDEKKKRVISMKKVRKKTKKKNFLKSIAKKKEKEAWCAAGVHHAWAT